MILAEEVFTKLNDIGDCDKRMSTARREREQSSRRVKINVDEAIDVIEVKGTLFDVMRQMMSSMWMEYSLMSWR